jgi:hypothetical protein
VDSLTNIMLVSSSPLCRSYTSLFLKTLVTISDIVGLCVTESFFCKAGTRLERNQDELPNIKPAVVITAPLRR